MYVEEVCISVCPYSVDDVLSSSSSSHRRTCTDKVCQAGAICQMSNGEPACVCPLSCPAEASDVVQPVTSSVVCGSDGMTYASVCQMKILACRTLTNVTVAGYGRCKGNCCHGSWFPRLDYHKERLLSMFIWLAIFDIMIVRRLSTTRYLDFKGKFVNACLTC